MIHDPLCLLLDHTTCNHQQHDLTADDSCRYCTTPCICATLARVRKEEADAVHAAWRDVVRSMLNGLGVTR